MMFALALVAAFLAGVAAPFAVGVFLLWRASEQFSVAFKKTLMDLKFHD